MFGDLTRDEVTSNILLTPGYPSSINYIIVVCIAIIPLTKLPLKYSPLAPPRTPLSNTPSSAEPVFGTFELLLGLQRHHLPPTPGAPRASNRAYAVQHAAVRAAVVAAITLISILVPSFDRIMALMGSAFCFNICIVLPVAFYLKLFGDAISRRERAFAWFLIISSSLLALMGIVWSFLPARITGARIGVASTG